MKGAASKGEIRHETCRHGRLTEAFHVDARGKETPMVAPLCLFTPPGPLPPALRRAWGGIIELDRDCAVCPCFEELKAVQS